MICDRIRCSDHTTSCVVCVASTYAVRSGRTSDRIIEGNHERNRTSVTRYARGSGSVMRSLLFDSTFVPRSRFEFDDCADDPGMAYASRLVRSQVLLACAIRYPIHDTSHRITSSARPIINEKCENKPRRARRFGVVTYVTDTCQLSVGFRVRRCRPDAADLQDRAETRRRAPRGSAARANAMKEVLRLTI